MKFGLQQWTRKNCSKAWRLCSSIFLLLIAFSETSVALVNLEKEFASNIVLESKQIIIPGFPGAFNPSIIRYEGKLLLSFRFIPNRSDNMTSYLGVVFLNDNLEVTGDPQILNLRRNSKVKSRAEDARLIIVKDRLYAVYSDNMEPKISRGGYRVYVVEIFFKDGRLALGEQECLSDFEGQTRELREKNWTPFDHNGELLLAYSLDPHLIFHGKLDGSGQCSTVAKTDSDLITWHFGSLRGGTPALLVGDEYLGFFHSSLRMATEHSGGVDMMHYFMGAYTFQKDAPFHITSMSLDPIVGEGFYSGPQFKGYWKPVRAIFPGGYIYDDNYIWVAYGKDDSQSWVAKLDRRALMESLIRLD